MVGICGNSTTIKISTFEQTSKLLGLFIPTAFRTIRITRHQAIKIPTQTKVDREN